MITLGSTRVQLSICCSPRIQLLLGMELGNTSPLLTIRTKHVLRIMLRIKRAHVEGDQLGPLHLLKLDGKGRQHLKQPQQNEKLLQQYVSFFFINVEVVQIEGWTDFSSLAF